MKASNDYSYRIEELTRGYRILKAEKRKFLWFRWTGDYFVEVFICVSAEGRPRIIEHFETYADALSKLKELMVEDMAKSAYNRSKKVVYEC